VPEDGRPPFWDNVIISEEIEPHKKLGRPRAGRGRGGARGEGRGGQEGRQIGFHLEPTNVHNIFIRRDSLKQN
jgi:hypothetical protein